LRWCKFEQQTGALYAQEENKRRTNNVQNTHQE